MFDRIVQNGDNLLKESEGTEQETLRKRLGVINDQWNGIKSHTKTRKEYIDRLYPLCQDYHDNYVLFSVFLEDSEKCLNGIELALDKEKTTKQKTNLQVGIFIIMHSSYFQ